MPVLSFDEWKQYLEKYPDAHLLQTAEWGALKSSFGWNVVRIVQDREIGAQILFRELPLGFTIAYIPKPFFKSQMTGGSDQFWGEVDLVCRQKKAIFLKLELDSGDDPVELSGTGFIRSPHNIQPPRTLIVDLTGSEDDILARMKQKCRYNIRLAQKKKVTVRSWDDLEGFYAMMQITGERDGFGVHSLLYYRQVYELFQPDGLADILVAEYEHNPLAALMVIARGKRSWYIYGASNNQERNRMPTYLLQWEAMRWARSRGCSQYDLWGIPDEDEVTLEAQFMERSDGLWGVYRFKRGFGGKIRRDAQSRDRVYMPWLYRIYLLVLGRRRG
ncbi:MAG: peptidoglycan bridge formation glycyltransferase FemA/FemB family protein [Anaerolineales bacterium]|nr:peptidoglycan bridge formation glycyltransferase FemA/FemB family protein [Anaerolineales bacterium]